MKVTSSPVVNLANCMGEISALQRTYIFLTILHISQRLVPSYEYAPLHCPATSSIHTSLTMHTDAGLRPTSGHGLIGGISGLERSMGPDTEMTMITKLEIRVARTRIKRQI